MDQVLLEEDKTLYFLKAMDMKDRRELGTLLEDDTQANGLVADWVAVKQACNKIDKRHQWLDDIDLVRPSVEKSKPSKEVEMPKQRIQHEKKIDDDLRTMTAISKEDKCFGTCVVFETTDDGASQIEACIKGDKECEIDMMKDLATKINIEEAAMNKTISVDNDHDRIFSTHAPETWAVVSKNQRETQEMEGVGEEPKVETNTCDEERSIIEACSIKRVNGYEAHEIEEIATKNDIESEVAMEELMADGRVEDSFTQVPETWAVAESQRETQEMEGGSKGKDQDGVHNIEAKIDMDESMVNDGSDKTFPTLVPKTWAVVSENQQKDPRDGRWQQGGVQI